MTVAYHSVGQRTGTVKRLGWAAHETAESRFHDLEESFGIRSIRIQRNLSSTAEMEVSDNGLFRAAGRGSMGASIGTRCHQGLTPLVARIASACCYDP